MTIYILIIALITSCLIFKPNEETKYNKFRLAIFILGIIIIILAEVSPQLIKYSNVSSYLFLISPFILSLVFYFFLIIKFSIYFQPHRFSILRIFDSYIQFDKEGKRRLCGAIGEIKGRGRQN